MSLDFGWWNIVMGICGCIIGFCMFNRRILEEDNEATIVTYIKIGAVSIGMGVAIALFTAI